MRRRIERRRARNARARDVLRVRARIGGFNAEGTRGRVRGDDGSYHALHPRIIRSVLLHQCNEVRLRSRPRGGTDRDPLIAQVGARCRPTAIDRANDIVIGHEHLVEENLIEVCFTGDLLQRSHLDTGGVHLDHHHRDALMLRGVEIGSHRGKAVRRKVAAGGPHLLAGDLPATFNPHPAGLDASRVGASLGFGVKLTDLDVAMETRPDPTLDLIVAAVVQNGERVPAANTEVGPRNAGELFVDHQLLNR